MLDKLRDHMWSQTDFITGEQYIDSDDLLVFIEKCGMLPPPPNGTAYLENQFIPAEEQCFWEREDE